MAQLFDANYPWSKLFIALLYMINGLLVSVSKQMIVAGIVLAIVTCIFSLKIKKYEYDNTTDDGVVKFNSFRYSIIHNILKTATPWTWGIAVLLFGLGVIAYYVK